MSRAFGENTRAIRIHNVPPLNKQGFLHFGTVLRLFSKLHFGKIDFL